MCIRDRIESNPLVSLRHPRPQGLGRYFKADARAEGTTVQIGGYEVHPGADLKSCRWFSYVLTPQLAPWAFIRENQAYRVIASLELFATLICVLLFCEEQDNLKNTFMYFTGVTDNQGNAALIHKSMSSKFPLYIILLELVEQLQARKVALDLRWQKREFNQAADDLLNGLFCKFSPTLRLNPCLTSFEWKILPKLMEEATKLDTVIRERKSILRSAAKTAPRLHVGVKMKKRKRLGLRETDPW